MAYINKERISKTVAKMVKAYMSFWDLDRWGSVDMFDLVFTTCITGLVIALCILLLFTKPFILFIIFVVLSILYGVDKLFKWAKTIDTNQ